MMNSTALISIEEDNTEDSFSDLFPDIAPLDPLDVKKDEIATQLAALMTFAKRNRTALADELGWKKSRVSNVLSGKSNLTIRTIWDIASHLNFDFDLVFRSPNEKRPPQPWQKVANRVMLNKIVEVSQGASHIQRPAKHHIIEIQTAQQVATDLMRGSHRSHYFSLQLPSAPERGKSITIEAKPQTDFITASSTRFFQPIKSALKESA